MVMNAAQWGATQAWFNDAKTQADVVRSQHRRDAESAARESIQRNAKTISDALFASRRMNQTDSVSKGLYLARELEHVMQEVLRTPRPEMSALNLFDLDTSVPPGAERFTVRRIENTGRANYYDGAGSNIPAANVFREEESWPLHPIVSGYQWSLFDNLSAEFAGFALEQELRDGTLYAIDEFINSKAWTGDVQRQALGVLNQPYVPKTTFGLTLGDAADGEDIAQEILRQARFASARTEGVFKPNRIITSIRIADYLAERELGQFKTASITERVLDKSNYVKEIIGVPELAGAGPGGTDVMLFDHGPDRRKGFSNVMAQTPTFLPVQQVGMKFTVPCYAIYGGVKTEQPLNSLICYVNLDTGFEGVY